ncbi:DgyrCDS5889 [Dimorphilus gyrociliatus]|uniref:DgyrCDS5889 n=1 Tax=Dimorphilus gyrociliatus TaxID=2664684 RepID=A0A7I8VM28_9ANNE|nr:DgyrCDS5889 [Dimorphilus gyrociliatus]
MNARHGDMWTHQFDGSSFGSKNRDMFLFRDRQEMEDKWSYPEGLNFSQRDRIEAEKEYKEKMKLWRRRREMMLHRLPIDMLLGGTKVVMTERMDILGEIRRLKQVELPTRAKDLYVGRGIRLPPDHTINRPKHKLPIANSYDLSSINKTTTTERAPNIQRSKTDVSRIHRNKTKVTLRMPAKAKTQLSSHPKRLAAPSDSPEQIPSVAAKPSPAPLKFPEPSPPTEKVEEFTREQGTKEEEQVSQNDHYPNQKKGTLFPNPTPSPPSPPPPVEKVPKPLKGFADYTKLVDAEQLIQLQKTFKRLDSDADGHVQFDKIEKEYLNDMTKQQIKYLRHIYQVESETTFFGEKEFVPFFKLIETIRNLEKTFSNSFDTVNFDQLEEEISKYMALFLKVDVEGKGEGKLDDLCRLLAELDRLEMDSEGLQLLKTSFKVIELFN